MRCVGLKVLRSDLVPVSAKRDESEMARKGLKRIHMTHSNHVMMADVRKRFAERCTVRDANPRLRRKFLAATMSWVVTSEERRGGASGERIRKQESTRIRPADFFFFAK